MGNKCPDEDQAIKVILLRVNFVMIKIGYPDEDGSLERKWDYVLLRIIPGKGMEIAWCA